MKSVYFFFFSLLFRILFPNMAINECNDGSRILRDKIYQTQTSALDAFNNVSIAPCMQKSHNVLYLFACSKIGKCLYVYSMVTWSALNRTTVSNRDIDREVKTQTDRQRERVLCEHWLAVDMSLNINMREFGFVCRSGLAKHRIQRSSSSNTLSSFSSSVCVCLSFVQCLVMRYRCAAYIRFFR